MKNYEALASAIIKEQEKIIGPLAWVEATKVSNLTIKDKKVTILKGSGKSILVKLVKQYETLFGQASIEACKDAVRPLISKMRGVEIPELLS